MYTNTPVKGLSNQNSSAMPDTAQVTISQPAATRPAATTRPASVQADAVVSKPVVVQPVTIVEPLSADKTRSSLAFDDKTRESILHELKKFISAEFNSLRQELKEYFRDEIKDTRDRVYFLEGRVDSIENQIVDDTASAAAWILEEAMDALKKELNDRDQDLLLNDVQVANVPEEPGENAVNLAMRICTKLGLQLDARDIVSVHRAGRIREAGQPRPLVLRLARRIVRDQLLQCARTRRGATTEGLGLNSAPRRFYINERLTTANRQLFQQTRDAARAASWNYVWTRNGRILVRKSADQPLQCVRCLADLDIFMPIGNNYTSP